MEETRRATAGDVARLVEMARAAAEELRPTKGGDVWARREARPEPLEPGFRDEVDDPARCCLVGTLDGSTVGYAMAHVEALNDGAPLAVLTDLYVEPAGRAVGLGEVLMDAVVTWASGQGCVGIDAIVLPGNRETKNFFETFHAVARAIIVHRRL
ncbi:MAG: GNAT family N-acetyltransferase [Acidimicrobiia bacterium]